MQMSPSCVPLVVASLFASAALAAPADPVPGQVPVQGFLSDADDVAIDGEVDMSLALVDGSGAAVWSSERRVVVTRGTFTLFLGDVTALDLRLFDTHPELQLQVTVEGDAFPPMELGHAAKAGFAEMAAWADVAGDAQTLDGQAASDFRAAGPVPWDDLVDIPSDLGVSYTAGDGLALGGTTFSVDETWVRDVCYDDPTELTAVLDGVYRPAGAVPWADLTDVPAGLADGDQDTTYTAGSGLTLNGTTLAVDAAADATAAVDAVQSSGQFVEQPAGGAPLSLSRRTIEKDLDNGDLILRYSEDGVELDRLSLNVLTPGALHTSTNGLIAYLHGDSETGTDSELYLDIEGMSSLACMMVPSENDRLRGYPREHATDVGNSYNAVWGNLTTATLAYTRVGWSGEIFWNYEAYVIVCM